MKRIVEIKGSKIEFDDSEATKIESFKVGDHVKVLVKSYGDAYSVYLGIIASFETFETLPTMTVAYLETGYSSVALKQVAYNRNTKDIELSPLTNPLEVPLTEERCLELLDRQIATKMNELEAAKAQKDFFERQFAKVFKV